MALKHDKLTLDEFLHYAPKGEVEGITSEVARWLEKQLELKHLHPSIIYDQRTRKQRTLR